jgi:O-antigen/teichoic acid export membrane protein
LLSVINQLGMLACMVALRRRVPGLWKKGAARVDETERARFRTWRVDFLIIQITGAVLWGSDTLLAGALVDAAASARVAVAVRAYGIVNIFATVVGSALGPALAQEWARGDLARARRVGLEATQLVGGVVIVCVLGLLSAGNAIVDLWVGPGVFTGQVAWSAYGVLFGVEGFVSVAYAFTTQAGQHRAFARWSVGEALLKLGLAWFLSRFLGIAGVALGSAIAHVAIAGWVLPRTYAQALGTSTVGYIVGAARPALVGTTAFIAFYGAARLLYPHPGKLATVAIGTASGVAFVIAFLALGIGTELRGRLASMIPFRKR